MVPTMRSTTATRVCRRIKLSSSSSPRQQLLRPKGQSAPSSSSSRQRQLHRPESPASTKARAGVEVCLSAMAASPLSTSDLQQETGKGVTAWAEVAIAWTSDCVGWGRHGPAPGGDGGTDRRAATKEQRQPRLRVPSENVGDIFVQCLRILP